MSTLQHTSQPALKARFNRRIALIAAVVLLVAGTVAIWVAASSDSGSKASLPPVHKLSASQRQAHLGMYAGPRYGMARPGSSASAPEPTRRLYSERFVQAHLR
jgi:hypothetical protein